MEVQEAIQQGKEILEIAGVKSADLDAQLIMAHLLNVKREWLHAHSTDLTELSILNDYELLINKRAARVPLAYITNEREFYGLSLYVDERVLIPRPETEALVAYVLEQIELKKKAKVLDVGTGSGAIALALKNERSDLEVHAVDISEPALEVARTNAEKLNLDITLHASNVLSRITDTFDVIVANLPYLRIDQVIDDETLSEPEEALYANDAGLEFIKIIADQAIDHLVEKGLLVLECETDQIDKIKDYTKKHYTPIFDDKFMVVLKLRK